MQVSRWEILSRVAGRIAFQADLYGFAYKIVTEQALIQSFDIYPKINLLRMLFSGIILLGLVEIVATEVVVDMKRHGILERASQAHTFDDYGFFKMGYRILPPSKQKDKPKINKECGEAVQIFTEWQEESYQPKWFSNYLEDQLRNLSREVQESYVPLQTILAPRIGKSQVSQGYTQKIEKLYKRQQFSKNSNWAKIKLQRLFYIGDDLLSGLNSSFEYYELADSIVLELRRPASIK